MAALTAMAQLPTLPEPTLFPRPDAPRLIDYFPLEIPDSATMAADSLSIASDSIAADSIDVDFIEDEIEFDEWGFPTTTTTYYRTMPEGSYSSPMVFDTYMWLEPLTIASPDHRLLLNPGKVFGWIDELSASARLLHQTQQRIVMDNPEVIRYNLANLPEPPKHYKAIVEPETNNIVLTEVTAPKVSADQASDVKVDIDKRLWLKQFNASLQFSQAYVSPNWYQGGNNNLNMLANIFYNVKLNERFYKNIMFETTVQYKLGLNNAPDDSLRNYSISEDLLQLTSKFGLRASKRWFYSVTVAFKTQILSSYKVNSNSMKSAFLSPGELNVGLGMTYDYANPQKTFTANASISPLSWNMKTCVNHKINETSFGIDPGRKTVNQFGSSAECNMTWKIAYNINYRARLFAFTNYEYFQGDWEHTLMFNINKYLSTQIYAHMRYDTSTPRLADSDWHHFQFKEILSFGLSYTFK